MANLFGEPDMPPEEKEDHHDVDEQMDEQIAAAGSLVDHDSRNAGLKPPRQMDCLLGHQHIETELISLAQSGKLPHALILAGPKGIGKATLAYRLARYVFKNAETSFASSSADIPTDDAVFRQVASGGHPDFLTIERKMDDKKGQLKSIVDVKDARRVVPFLRMTASYGSWRIVIIDDADTMNRNAQNAILKVLEEPPENALLMLVVHRPGALVPTIRSRCRMVRFDPLPRDDFDVLVRAEFPETSIEDIALLHEISKGSVSQAIMIQEEGGLDVIRNVIAMLSDWPEWRWPDIHNMADAMGRNGTAAQQSYGIFCDAFIWFFDTMLRSKANGEPLHDILQQDKAIQSMHEHYSLKEWIEMNAAIRERFQTFERSNLDKRQSVLGAFTVFENTKAA